jgi:hypothetical protein
MIYRIAAATVLVIGGALLTSCVLPPPDPNLIGTLEIDGPNGYLNEQNVAGTHHLMINDHVATGPGTSAKIIFLHGAGQVQLDENTDPWFILGAGGCIIVKMLHGQLYADAKRVCIQGDDLSLAMGSKINLRSNGKSHELTVIEGRVEVSRPVSQVLVSGQQLRYVPGSPPIFNSLTAEQIRNTTVWRTRYFVAPVVIPIPTPTPVPQPLTPVPRTLTPVPQPPPTPPPVTPKVKETVISGWCCDGKGNVSSSTSLTCARSGGRFFSKQDEAKRSCPKPIG